MCPNILNNIGEIMPKASYIASKGLVITPGAGLSIEKVNGTTSSNAVTVTPSGYDLKIRSMI